MADKKPKVVFELGIECPHCKKGILIKKIRKKISDSVKAEFEVNINVSKATQQTIKESTKPKKKDVKGKIR